MSALVGLTSFVRYVPGTGDLTCGAVRVRGEGQQRRTCEAAG
jgi:hypothetical protein